MEEDLKVEERGERGREERVGTPEGLDRFGAASGIVIALGALEDQGKDVEIGPEDEELAATRGERLDNEGQELTLKNAEKRDTALRNDSLMTKTKSVSNILKNYRKRAAKLSQKARGPSQGERMDDWMDRDIRRDQLNGNRAPGTVDESYSQSKTNRDRKEDRKQGGREKEGKREKRVKDLMGTNSRL